MMLVGRVVRCDDDETMSASATVTQRCEPAGSRDVTLMKCRTPPRGWRGAGWCFRPSLCSQVSLVSTRLRRRDVGARQVRVDWRLGRGRHGDDSSAVYWRRTSMHFARSLGHVHFSVSFSLCTWSVLDPDRRIVAICRARLYKARDVSTCSSSNTRRDSLLSVSLTPNWQRAGVAQIVLGH